MPPKRKGATAEDEIEGPPVKLTKGNKKEVDKGSAFKSVHLYTREEYNRLLAQVAGHRETLEEPVNFRKFKSKVGDNLPGNLEEELE